MLIHNRLCRSAVRTFLIALAIVIGTFVSARAETVRLTAMGDSIIQGYGLTQGDGIVPQLEAWLLSQGHDVQIVNAGVSGETSAGGAARIDWTLADNPDGLIVLFGGNDLLRGLAPRQMYENLSTIIKGAQGRDTPVFLIGLQAPSTYGNGYKTEFDMVFTKLALEYNLMLYPDIFAAIKMAALSGTSTTVEVMQGDNIHPNVNGVQLIVENLGPEVVKFLEPLTVP